MSSDGNTLYASSTDEVYSWAYDSSARTVSDRETLIGNMSGSDHTTRTLVLSKNVPGMLVVARGSTSNIDIQAASLDSGISQVKAFNLNDRTGVYSYGDDGLLLGWGLRNEVGVAEHPNSGGIYGIENSADQLTRMGVDIHEDNPGEELNFLGYLNGTEDANQGKNFGYPWCFSAWGVEELPENGDLSVGSQFAIDPSTASDNQNKTDEFCAEQVEPRLVFQAHMAPLDIKFNNSGTEAWISFHGSWNRDDPVGYKLSVVGFDQDGEPLDESTSKTAATDIFWNQDLSKCPDNCFRPVGMAIDSQGRIFVSSDSSGEVYLITRTDRSGSPASGGSPTSSSTASATASATNAANVGGVSGSWSYIVSLLAWLALA
jgi:glucose/arabinose dehydrogenase